ncbi:MAG: endolytic transglycosylase MltG [Spirochaetia bacterium]|nr:endolytic transglycosylase MltG [Spirochaetia bacterium]
MKYKFISGISLLLLIFWIAFLWFSPNRAPGNGDRVVDFEIPRGAGPSSIGKKLQKEGLIRDIVFFRMMLVLTVNSGNIKAGLYELNDGMTNLDVIDVITEGKVQTASLTIPEGWNNKQIGDYLAEKGYVKSKEEFLKITKNKNVLKEFSIAADSTEGYLFPDTYVVPRRYPAEKIHRVMVKHFFEKLEQAGIPSGLTPMDLHDRVILASIIEREAVHPEELPVMASVFINRINKKMRLESCATVQYLLPNPKKKLYEKDLHIKSPYNTYLHRGLPPGPISNPGFSAMKAAFYPDSTPFLFFVLKPDEGRHHFSETYSEHLKAKKKYLGD